MKVAFQRGYNKLINKKNNNIKWRTTMKNLQDKIAALETLLDYYETEYYHLNDLLKKCGFEKGIKTLKESAEEVLQEAKIHKPKKNKKSKI